MKLTKEIDSGATNTIKYILDFLSAVGIDSRDTVDFIEARIKYFETQMQIALKNDNSADLHKASLNYGVWIYVRKKINAR
jgi:hypothetical protein